MTENPYIPPEYASRIENLDLQKGTGVIPTLDANGASLSPDIEDRLREIIADVSHLKLEAYIHPDTLLHWENSSVVISSVVTNQVDRVLMDFDLSRWYLPLRRFAGVPVQSKLEVPANCLRVIYKSGGYLASGEPLEPWVVAQIINLGFQHV